ncbi:LamG domain-containing protein [Streptomyces sp. NPDC094032]|uniref:LamG domain-containing protein n=1 Tax=Streptomyces sp. NPDC094032 TaxID=3155308 RepID=UPI00332B2EF3
MSGRFRKRGLLLGSCLAAVVGATAVPGTAYAAGNLPPKQPLISDLQTLGRPCATGADVPYVGQPPRLSALLSDPVEDDVPGNQEQVSGEFELSWTDAAGVERHRSFTTYPRFTNRTHTLDLPADIPADTVISWRVRGNDGTANGAWSSDAPGAACRFVYDNASPSVPAVTSPEYPDSQREYGGVGDYGSFVVDSPSPDVVAYQYDFMGGPRLTVRPTEPGGPATIRRLALSSGPDTLSVQSVDRAGRVSASTTYYFRVKSGRTPVAHWKLADPAGATSAAAEAGTAAAAGTGVAFGGPAPSGTGLASTAVLDGSAHGFLTPNAPAADPRKTFAVGAWVRPAQTDRSMTVASQDTAESAAFALGLQGKDSGASWTFTIGDAKVSGGAPEAGEWAHLLGVYDAETGQAQLFVNGREVGTKAEAAPVESAGAFQIGRIRSKNGYQDRWIGEIGDVRVHDRVVVADEASRLAYRKPRLLGHWSFDTVTDGASPERNGGAPLRLAPGASLYRGPDSSCEIDPSCPWQPYPLVGAANLRLDGEGGHALTDGPVVDTGDSWTLGVVARIDDADATRPMTVLSQAGEHTDAFKLRYDPETYAYQLVVPERDEVGAPEKVVSSVTGPSGNNGQLQLTIVYDDAADTLTLYADGIKQVQASTTLPNGWKSGGALQVGRGHTADGWGEYLKGDVDEIQAFAGAVRASDVPMLGQEGDPCLCG